MRLSVYRLLRPFLFLFDAERAHELVTALCRLVWRFHLGRKITHFLYGRRVPLRPTLLAGLQLRNPIGLAAGFDKDGNLVPGIENLGFGFIEIGTITPRPQTGNPRPRLFRIADRRALLNQMGFNNEGAIAAVARLRRIRGEIGVPLGVNIGRNRDTPNSEALADYETLLRAFEGLADYFTVNVSSPNTPGLRNLQTEEFLSALGAKIASLGISRPVFLKLGPDLDAGQLESIARLCGKGKPFAGLVLTNTLPTDLGGISGLPLKGPSLSALKIARRFLSPEASVISVGGIETAQDVEDRLEAGATAVQIYSALIYQGPSAPKKLLTY